MSEKLKGSVSFETQDNEPKVESNEAKEMKEKIDGLNKLKDSIGTGNPQQQQLKDNGQANFSIPTQTVLLPSKGLYYPPHHPLHNSEVVEIRQMTASDEDVITSRSLIRSGKVVDVLLQSCIVTKGVDAKSLLPADRDSIMIGLRANSYGEDYKVDITCETCLETTKEYEFDLKTLDMKTLETPPDGEGLYSYVLPSGNTVRVKLLNHYEELEVQDLIEKLKKMSKSEVDRSITTRLKKQVIEVNGDSSPQMINQTIDHLNVRDSRSLRKFISDLEPEVVMEHEFECRHCGSKSDVSVPITAEFFFPNA